MRSYAIHTLMKSCIETVAREWRLAEMELSEAENTPATKRPDSPCTPPSICSTNSGTNWSWLLMTPDLSQQLIFSAFIFEALSQKEGRPLFAAEASLTRRVANYLCRDAPTPSSLPSCQQCLVAIHSHHALRSNLNTVGSVFWLGNTNLQPTRTYNI